MLLGFCIPDIPITVYRAVPELIIENVKLKIVVFPTEMI